MLWAKYGFCHVTISSFDQVSVRFTSVSLPLYRLFFFFVVSSVHLFVLLTIVIIIHSSPNNNQHLDQKTWLDYLPQSVHKQTFFYYRLPFSAAFKFLLFILENNVYCFILRLKSSMYRISQRTRVKFSHWRATVGLYWRWCTISLFDSGGWVSDCCVGLTNKMSFRMNEYYLRKYTIWRSYISPRINILWWYAKYYFTYFVVFDLFDDE